jgi:outer membrane biosynthesis protein TonB
MIAFCGEWLLVCWRHIGWFCWTGADYRYEAAFPFASEKEKDAEKAYIEKHHAVVHDTNVKGLWVTSDVALKIAKEYELEEYIKAMIEASPDKPSDTLTIVPNETKETTKTKATKEPKQPKQPKEAKETKETPEPKETKEAKPKKEPSTPKLAPEAPRRSRRSVSPKKSAAPKIKVPKAPSSTSGATRGRKKKGTGSVVDDESVASTSSPTIPYATFIKAEEAIERVAEEEGKSILDSIKVGVQNPSPPSTHEISLSQF